MKNNNKIGFKGTLKNERKTMIWLSVIIVITFIITLLLEILFVSSDSTDNHIVFVQNILLAAFGSAVISLVCIAIPFFRKKHDEIIKILNIFKSIYYEYSKIIVFIKNNITNEEFEYDSSIIDSNLEQIKNINSLINQVEDEYVLSDITSENFENIINVLKNEITRILYVLEQFFITIKTFEVNDKKDDSEKTKSFNPTYIRAKHEYYSYLLNEIEEIYKYDDLKKLFSNLFGLFNAVNKAFINELLDTAKLIDKTNYNNATIATGMLTVVKIERIYSKFSDEYLRESLEINQSLTHLFYENLDMKDENNKMLYDEFKKDINALIDNNETKKAREKIDEFKKEHSIE